MPVPYLRKFLLPALLVLAQIGCQVTSPPKSAGTAAVAPPMVVVEISNVPPPVVAVDIAPPVATNFTKAVAPVPWPTSTVSHSWIPFQVWTDHNGFGKPRLVASTAATANPGYESETTNGIVSIKVGKQLVFWNGLSFWLGYAPQIIKGVPHIHALDVQKLLQPLVQPPSLITKSNRVVVIDPGHGGVDTGTRSVAQNQMEKDFTLDWALRLKPLLAANGWTVYLTRTNDMDVSLATRLALADRFNADFFVSLHFNSAFPSATPCGVETYCLTPVGLPSSVARNYEDDPRQVFANNAFDTANLQYAWRLHRAVLSATQSSDGGVRHARFMGVLRGQKRPAVLIEGGYLSNPQEARKIGSLAYRQKLAESVAQALE